MKRYSGNRRTEAIALPDSLVRLATSPQQVVEQIEGVQQVLKLHYIVVDLLYNLPVAITSCTTDRSNGVWVLICCEVVER